MDAVSEQILDGETGMIVKRMERLYILKSEHGYLYGDVINFDKYKF